MRYGYILWVVNGTSLIAPWGPAHSTLAGAQGDCPVEGTWSEHAREAWDTLRVWAIDKRRGALTFWVVEIPVVID